MRINWKKLVLDHNDGCTDSCGKTNPESLRRKDCEIWLPYGHTCPECPLEWMIDPVAETMRQTA